MDKHYNLSIADDTTVINVDTVDPDSITRILALAGLPVPTQGVSPMTPGTPQSTPVAPPPTMPPGLDGAMNGVEIPFSMGGDEEGPEMGNDGCAVCGAEDHGEIDCPDIMAAQDAEIDEFADFDLANQDNKSDGHELDVNSYEWQGPATPQRQVKGMQGDNPLMTELHDKLLSEYESYLAEDTNEDTANVEAGLISPLTNPTKPEFDKDPTRDEEPVTDGSRSPLSRIVRQDAFK